MPKIVRWILIAVVAVVLVVALVAVAYTPKPPPVTMPNPNGYDAFVEAGRVAGDASKYSSMTATELEEFLKKEAKTLTLVRGGLSRESRVRTTNSMAYLEAHMPEMARIRALAQVLSAEGRLAELQNKPEEAARSYLDIVRLGNEMARGGVLIDGLLGIAVETHGIKNLGEVSSKLPGPASREMAAALEKIDAAAESAEVTLQTEKEWVRRSADWRGRMALLLRPQMTKGAEDEFTQKREQVELRRRQMMVNLAAQAYRAEQGKGAEGYADIVPAYLKAVPNDPVRKGNIPFP